MAKVVIVTDATLELTLTLTEVEARALEALTGYSMDSFLKVFYEKMGRHYLEPHEGGLRALFGTIRRQVPEALALVDQGRKILGPLRGAKRTDTSA